MATDSTNIRTVTEKVRIIELSKNDILSLLLASGVPVPRSNSKGPLTNDEHTPDATVTFRVPSGADWSGMDVDVDKDYPVTVTLRWREETRG